MKKLLKWGVIGFVGLVVIGVIASAGSDTSQENQTSDNQNSRTEQVQNTSNQESQQVEEQEEPMVVTTAEFVAEFDKNQLAAEDKYEGKLVQFTGYIDNISEDILGEYFVIIKPTNEEYYFDTTVQCYFEDRSALTDLENGQEVTLQGRFDTQVANVMVKECEVVN